MKARRCVSSTTTSTEHLVDLVTASCNSCRNIQDYDWDTTRLRAKGTMSADGVWTSRVWSTASGTSVGVFTKQVENDTDSDAATVPGGARVTWLSYGNTSYPMWTERRILSELKPGGTCTDATSTDCRRTIRTLSTGGDLATRQEIGFTYDSGGTITAYNFTSTWTRDAQGRVTLFEGPRGVLDDVEYTYYGAANALSTNYLNQTKRKKDNVPTYVTTSTAEYDIWGEPKRFTDANSKLTCLTYNASFGLVASRRVLIGTNQTDCTSTNTGDETTSYTYDSHRRVTLTTLPRLNCVANTYDTNGNLSELQEQDYVSGACQSTGDKTVYTYDYDGLVTKIEWKDDAGTVKRKQEYTYLADRHRDRVVSPIDAAKHQDWAYDDDGVPSEVLWEDYGTSNARTQWDVDNLDRETAVRRYTTATLNEAFTITPGVQLDLPTRVRDPLTHDLDIVWDDLSRKVKQLTPEGGTNFYVYDEAGNLTTLVMASGSTDTKTTSYSYDNMNRKIAENTGDTTCTGATGDDVNEVRYVYDALGGETCPTGSSCANLAGHLAYAKVKIYCDGALGDKHFDQLTFYAYTDGGRAAETTVKDDAATPRIGRVIYAYDKNGNVTRIDYPSDTYPAASAPVYTYGSSGNYSDDDRVTLVARDTTTILEAVAWFPFGPIDTYTGQNVNGAASPQKIKVTYKREADYGMSEVVLDQPALLATAGAAYESFGVTYVKDDRMRYSQRDFGYGSASQKDMFFLYDNLSRVTCRTTASAGSCPGSGGASQMESITYNTSSDRTQLILNNSVIASTTFNYVYTASTSDKLSCLYYGTASSCASGSNVITYAHDTRGNRTSDDDNTYTGASNDARTYTYDGRNNLLTVTGKYYVSASTMNNYLVTYAYDEINRLIFKSFKNTDTGVEGQWFFYYDLSNRVIQAKYTPNIDPAQSSTFSVFQWYWLRQTPVLYYQVDWRSGASTTTRRYLYSDEQGRPHTAWSWPSTGNSTRVWEVEAGLFGWDVPTVGATIYQPLRFPGQKYDADTEAVTLNGSAKKTLRPGLADNHYRVYDAFVGAFVQLDPLVTATWDAHGFVMQNPVGDTDPAGLSGVFLPLGGLPGGKYGLSHPCSGSTEYCGDTWGSLGTGYGGISTGGGGGSSYDYGDCPYINGSYQCETNRDNCWAGCNSLSDFYAVVACGTGCDATYDDCMDKCF